MSEPLNATRAPESDAAELTEPSIISKHDSKAQTGATMGEHCTSDRPVTSGQVPSGELTKFDEIDVYVSKPADYPNTPGKLLLLLTGGTGVHSINNQIQADMYAKEGFLVVMPDQFSGDPAPNSKTMTEDTGSSWLEFIKLRTAETAKSFLLDMWLARHTTEKVMPIINKVLDTAKDEYADAVANGGGVYAAGYCFGAKYVIILAGEDPNKSIRVQPTNDEEQGAIPTKGPFIKAGAIAHATLVTRDDLADVKAPLSMACVGKYLQRRYSHHVLTIIQRMIHCSLMRFWNLERRHLLQVIFNTRSRCTRKYLTVCYHYYLNWFLY